MNDLSVCDYNLKDRVASVEGQLKAIGVSTNSCIVLARTSALKQNNTNPSLVNNMPVNNLGNQSVLGVSNNDFGIPTNSVTMQLGQVQNPNSLVSPNNMQSFLTPDASVTPEQTNKFMVSNNEVVNPTTAVNPLPDIISNNSVMPFSSAVISDNSIPNMELVNDPSIINISSNNMNGEPTNNTQIMMSNTNNTAPVITNTVPVANTPVMENVTLENANTTPVSSEPLSQTLTSQSNMSESNNALNTPIISDNLTPDEMLNISAPMIPEPEAEKNVELPTIEKKFDIDIPLLSNNDVVDSTNNQTITASTTPIASVSGTTPNPIIAEPDKESSVITASPVEVNMDIVEKPISENIEKNPSASNLNDKVSSEIKLSDEVKEYINNCINESIAKILNEFKVLLSESTKEILSKTNINSASNSSLDELAIDKALNSGIAKLTDLSYNPNNVSDEEITLKAA